MNLARSSGSQTKRATASHGGKIISVSLDVATQAPKVLDPDVYRTAGMFFG